MDPRLTALRVKEHPSLIVGIKTAHYRGPEWDPVDLGDFRTERPSEEPLWTIAE